MLSDAAITSIGVSLTKDLAFPSHELLFRTDDLSSHHSRCDEPYYIWVHKAKPVSSYHIELPGEATRLATPRAPSPLYFSTVFGLDRNPLAR